MGMVVQSECCCRNYVWSGFVSAEMEKSLQNLLTLFLFLTFPHSYNMHVLIHICIMRKKEVIVDIPQHLNTSVKLLY